MDLLVFVDVTLIMMLIRKELGWDYSQTLEEGIRKTYDWIKEQING
jgi:nucleoside-diphosphate-sugar epimerase